ncbi:bilirubin oxidase [Phlyctema vagabunda]|uniref:Bilirubin oxidase n=1 Tax=Phlyctema vagabunda TaxID=108571 RepID=A0ABR4PSZ0_9HELO
MTKIFWAFVLLFTQLLSLTRAGDDEWLSPVYTNFYQSPLPIPPVKTPKYSYVNATTGRVINYYEITISPFQQQVYPGLGPANLVGYDGISPGPTFRVEKGQESVVRFINNGPMDNSVHLHGSYSRAPFDGWAEDTTKNGQYKDYYYPNNQRGRTLWYHDHAVSHTAENAYFGQAGFYILHDPDEDRHGFPKGAYDVPLALSAKRYKSNGDLFSPASETDSLFGDVIHVNGQPWPYLKVEPRKYRFRFLDTSVSRAFQLYFEKENQAGTKLPFTVIASDAGLLSSSVSASTLEIAMAERWEVIFDFSTFAKSNVTLRNNRDVQADEDYNSTDKVMKFIVGDTVTDPSNNGAVPSALSTLNTPKPKTGVDRTFRFEKTGSEWRINGVVFSDVKNRILAKPPRGTTEVWQLENNSGGWSHPVHIHLVDFQISSRVDGKRNVLPYEAAGLKDVVLLGRNEKVKVIAKYAPWDGVYMFHCHNLIHEDHDMMAAFNVTEIGDFGYPETTRFIDPMEERWRSKNYDASKFTESYIKTVLLPMFSGLDAYGHEDAIEKALDDFYANGGPPRTSTSSALSTLSTVTKTTISSVTGTPTTTSRTTTSTQR